MRTISELIRLDGRSAIVTGGAGHIGFAVCETLMELGAEVCILDIDDAESGRKCTLLNSRGYNRSIFSIPVDFKDDQDTRNAILRGIETMDGLDILIHSAAFVGTTNYPGWSVPFDQQTLSSWEAAMRVNLTAGFLMVQTAGPFLGKSEGGSVVFIGSIYGVLGPDTGLYEGTSMVTPAAYAASKGGLLQLTRYLATVLAPHIRVNMITAGGVSRGQPEQFQERYIGKTPLGRMACEEDFKGAVAYLSSDLSSYVTGSNLFVDGGWTAW